jgi:hypothetical protein
MARDLIPPPSPARRPQPDATPPTDGRPWLIELPPEPVTPAPDAASPEPPRNLVPTRFRNRFGFLMGALGGAVITTAAVLVVLLTSTGDNSVADYGLAKNFSAWQPTESSIENGAPEIAAHIQPKYRGDDGRELVSVTAGPISIPVLMRPENGNIYSLGQKGVLYSLNGLGALGSIKGGTPSRARHELVRREALELALYSFRYLRGVTMVVALLPPSPPSPEQTAAVTAGTVPPPAGQAVFFRPGDLKAQLQVPLGTTVPKETPKPSTMDASGESKSIDALTNSNLFQASVQQAQGSPPYLVLERPPPKG